MLRTCRTLGICSQKHSLRKKAHLGDWEAQHRSCAMNGTGAWDEAGAARTVGRLPHSRILPPGHDSEFLAAVWASVQSPVPEDRGSRGDPMASEVPRVAKHLRDIDGRFQNLRELFRKGKPLKIHLFAYSLTFNISQPWAKATQRHSCCSI